MGRKSLEATKVRFNVCARVAVTFLRAWWLEATVVDFLCVVLLDLCAVLDFVAVVVDEDCFLVGVVVLSCANNAQFGTTSCKARKTARSRLRILTLFSLARFFSACVYRIRYKMDSHL